MGVIPLILKSCIYIIGEENILFGDTVYSTCIEILFWTVELIYDSLS